MKRNSWAEPIVVVHTAVNSDLWDYQMTINRISEELYPLSNTDDMFACKTEWSLQKRRLKQIIMHQDQRELKAFLGLLNYFWASFPNLVRSYSRFIRYEKKPADCERVLITAGK